MSKFAPHKWEYDSLQRVCDGDEPVAFVYEGKYTRLIAAAPELYWMVYNLLYELKRGNGARAEYVKQVIPQIEDLLNRIYGTVEGLKPCPFCGGTPYVISDKKNHTAVVKCPLCVVRMEDYSANGEFEHCVRAWNRREQS